MRPSDVIHETIARTPPNLLQFLGIEEQQLLASLAKMQEEMGYVAQRTLSIMIEV